MAWVVEITGYDIVNAAEKTLRFAMGQGIAFTDAAYAPGALTKWSSATQKVEIDGSGVVKSTADGGSIALINLPDEISEAGPLDDLAEYAWQGRPANLYWVPGTTWAARQRMASGVLEQPVANLATGGSVDPSITFSLRDPRAALDTPLQTLKYGGTNSGGLGVDGAADIKGKPRPVLYGVVSNIPGVKVNESELIYELADKAATVLCVRDGGIPLTVGVARANIASLEANDPGPSKYDYCATSTGTYVRLGSKPIATLSFDAQEGANSAARTHAQIWKRIRTERCRTSVGDISAASVTATDAAAPNEIGFWWSEAVDQRAALDQVLASLSGFEVLDAAGDWNVAQLTAPSGTPVINLLIVGQDTRMKAADRPLVDLTRVRPNFAPNGAPAYRVNVQWGKNYTPMAEGDFNFGAVQRLKDKFAEEWRVETYGNATIWDPVANTGLFPNAPELTVPTGYQPGADGLTCPHALTEAQRLMALYSTMKQQYQAAYLPSPGDLLLPGQVVSLTFPGHGLSAGALFRVLQAGLTVEGARAKASLVIGFQT